MTRRTGRREQRDAKAKRAAALSRPELRQPTTPRASPASPTAMAVKIPDPNVERMVADFMARRGQANG